MIKLFKVIMSDHERPLPTPTLTYYYATLTYYDASLLLDVSTYHAILLLVKLVVIFSAIFMPHHPAQQFALYILLSK